MISCICSGLIISPIEKYWLKYTVRHKFSITLVLGIQLTLVISKSKDSLKYFEISVLWHIVIVELKKKINRTAKFTNEVCNLTPKVRDVLKIFWKRGEIAHLEQFLLLSTIFCYPLLDFHVKAGTRFSLRDKRLFQITEVELTRVNCISKWFFCLLSSKYFSECMFICMCA